MEVLLIIILFLITLVLLIVLIVSLSLGIFNDIIKHFLIVRASRNKWKK